MNILGCGQMWAMSGMLGPLSGRKFGKRDIPLAETLDDTVRGTGIVIRCCVSG